MDVLSNRELWSKAGFVVFEERDDAVQFWNACKSRDIAVQGGVSSDRKYDRYYVARDDDVSRQRAEWCLDFWPSFSPARGLAPCFELLPYEIAELEADARNANLRFFAGEEN